MSDQKAERKTPPALRGPEDMMRLLLRCAVPSSDIGSRGAIQYSREVAEFMVYFGLEFCAADRRFSSQRIKQALKDLDADEPVRIQ